MSPSKSNQVGQRSVNSFRRSGLTLFSFPAWGSFLQVPLAGAMPHPAPMAGHRLVGFNSIVLSFVLRGLDLVLCRLPIPGQCCPRLQRSPWLAIMGVCTRQEIVLGANRAVAEQTPPQNLSSIVEEVLKHFVHVRGNTDWHSAVMVAHCGFLMLFKFTHGPCFTRNEHYIVVLKAGGLRIQGFFRFRQKLSFASTCNLSFVSLGAYVPLQQGHRFQSHSPALVLYAWRRQRERFDGNFFL